MTTVTEVAEDTYRISTPVKLPNGADFTFAQFLIDDERPMLIHTGMHDFYEPVRAAVAEVLDPSKLAYVALLHFESDECGGMDRFIEGAPDAALAAAALSADLNLAGWNFHGRVEGHMDGDVIDLGKHKLRFLETPHVHHWDSMMLYDETTKSLFPSDLYILPGDQPAVVTDNLGSMMCEYYRQVGIFAHEDPVRRCVDRIEEIDPDWLHPMHGGSLSRETRADYTRALRAEPFAYEGLLLGRPLPH